MNRCAGQLSCFKFPSSPGEGELLLVTQKANFNGMSRKAVKIAAKGASLNWAVYMRSWSMQQEAVRRCAIKLEKGHRFKGCWIRPAGTWYMSNIRGAVQWVVGLGRLIVLYWRCATGH